MAQPVSAKRLIPVWLWALALSALLTLPLIGSSPLITRGEGREAIVADDIFRNSNWILPSGYGENVPSKPPMIHWVSACLAKVLGGLSEFTLRLPSSLGSILLIVYFAAILSRRVKREVALLSVLILATCVEWSRAAITMRVDMVLSASLAGALLGLFKWEERGLRGYPASALFLLSLGVLTKGPVALVVSGASLGLYLWILRYRVHTIILKISYVFIRALIIPSLWYFAAYLAAGDAFIHVVWQENFARFLGTMEDQPHEHSPFYLLGTLVVGMMPWSLLFLPALIDRVRSISLGKLKRRDLQGAFDRLKSGERIILFSKVCAFVIFLFFCIPASKRSVYILPLYPFLSLLIAVYLNAALEERERAFLVIVRIASTLSLILLLGILIGSAFPQILDSFPELSRDPSFLQLITEFLPQMNLFQIVVVTVALCFLVLLALNPQLSLWRTIPSVNKLGILSLLALLFVHGSARENFASAVSPRPFAEKASVLVGESKRVFSFEDRFFSLDYYLPQKLFEKECSFTYKGGDYVFVKAIDLDRFNACISDRFEVRQVLRSSHGIDEFGRFIELYRVEGVKPRLTESSSKENL